MSSKYLIESRIESWEILERLSTMIHGQIKKNVFLIKDSECKMLNTVQNKDEKISHCTVCRAIPPAHSRLDPPKMLRNLEISGFYLYFFV